MKLRLIVVVVFASMSLHAYEEENFMAPRWDTVPQAKKIEIKADGNKVKFVQTHRELKKAIEALKEKMPVIDEQKNNSTVVIETKNISAHEQEPVENPLAEAKAQINTVTEQIEKQEQPFYVRHEKNLIIGGVVVGVFIVSKAIHYYYRSH